MSEAGPEHAWTYGDIELVSGDKIRAFIYGELAVAESGIWLVLHRRSGYELGRFESKYGALDLGERLIQAGILARGRRVSGKDLRE
jgi:hypothetical protein